MKRPHASIHFLLLLMLVMSLLLAACGGSPEEAPPTETPPPPPTNTPAPTPIPPTPTPQPSPTPDIAASFVPFEDAASGLALSHPEGWFSQGMFGFFIFASNEALLDSPDPDEEGGVVLVVAQNSSDFETTNPVEGIETAVAEFGLGEGVEVVSGPERLTINGLDSAQALVYATSEEGNIPLSIFVTILIGEERSALFFGVTPRETEADFLPTFQAMAKTIVLTTPVSTVSMLLANPSGFLAYGETVDGTVSAAEETAVWGFSGLANDAVSVSATPNEDDFDLVIDVLDANGDSIINGPQDNSFGEERVSLTLPADGMYYVTITGYAGASGTFQLALQSGSATSGAIALGETVSGSVTASGPSIWEFSASAGEVLVITVTPLDDLDAVVDVLDAGGNSILPGGEVDESFGEERLPAVVIPANGKYTIAVRGFGGGAGSFSLTLQSAGAGAEGQLLAYGQIGSATLPGGETQSWSFYAMQADVVDITVAPLQDGFDLMVDVLDSSGFSILPDGEQDDFFDTEYLRVLFLEEEGFYTITVRGFEGSSGDYEIVVTESLGGLPGSILSAADSLEEGEIHAFPFTAYADETVRIYVWPESGFDVVVSLYNDDTGELIEEVDNNTGYEEIIFTVPELANYYFEIAGLEGGIGSYEVVMLATAGAYLEAAGGDEIYGRVERDAVLEYYIQGVTGDTLTVTLSSDENSDMVIALLDLDGNVLTEVDNAVSGGEETLTYTFTQDQKLVISIREFYNEVGKFFATITLQ